MLSYYLIMMLFSHSQAQRALLPKVRQSEPTELSRRVEPAKRLNPHHM